MTSVNYCAELQLDINEELEAISRGVSGITSFVAGKHFALTEDKYSILNRIIGVFRLSTSAAVSGHWILVYKDGEEISSSHIYGLGITTPVLILSYYELTDLNQQNIMKLWQESEMLRCLDLHYHAKLAYDRFNFTYSREGVTNGDDMIIDCMVALEALFEVDEEQKRDSTPSADFHRETSIACISPAFCKAYLVHNGPINS